MARKEKSPQMKVSILLQDLNPEEQANLEHRLPFINVADGSLIYSPDEHGEVLFLLKKGRIRLYRLSPEGKVLTTAIIEPGSVFGEMALLGQGMQDSFAEALEDSTLYTLSRRDVQEVLLSDPRISRRLLEIVSRRLSSTERKLEEFAFRNVPQRLASLLLQLAHLPASHQGGPVTLPRRYTHQQLAEMIGTYRETVTKVLNDFRKQELVRMDRGRIQLVDIEALQAMIAD